MLEAYFLAITSTTMFARLYTTKFVNLIKGALGAKLTKTQVQAIGLLLSEADKNGVTDQNQMAYILGTCWHECRFKSIKEIRAKVGTSVWSMQEKYWHTGYFGRGFSQLTKEANYKKFTLVVGIDLVKNPDAVLIPEIGAKILVYGMVNGSFTALGLSSKNRLSKYFKPGQPPDWLNARRIVNGTFQADKVASEALKILTAMIAFDLPNA